VTGYAVRGRGGLIECIAGLSSQSKTTRTFYVTSGHFSQ